jgi:hydroxymethylpyrimidine/phosphomethylpyrimidine kinase
MLTLMNRNSYSSPAVLLTIAGFDPSSGAGITADLKVFAAYQFYGVSAITALTVQSTQGVRQTEPVAPAILTETLNCLADDFEIGGVKIGMLATAANVEAVAHFLAGSGIFRDRVVLDPVLRSSSGRDLLDSEGVAALRELLLPRVGWVTPNVDELSVLAGVPVSDRDSVGWTATLLRMRYEGLNIVVTGGHLDPPDDFLLTSGGEEQWFPGTRIESSATHGTGCAFSSALLAEVILGHSPIEAVTNAKNYVREAMLAAPRLGHGRGPLHHLYRLSR